MTPAARPRSPDRPIRRRARETREKIERAALEAFAEAGFDGTSTGGIAKRAGVTQQLVIYHYETKLTLWQAVADGVFDALHARSEAQRHELDGLGDAERVAYLVRQFVLFSAEVPQLARFMMHEGDRASERLEWIVERHVRPHFEIILDALARAQDSGFVVTGDPAHVFFLVLGSSAMLAQPAQAKMLTGRDMTTHEEIDAYADLVVRAVFTTPVPDDPAAS